MSASFDSVCSLDCPGTCALKVTIDQGRLVSMAGHPDHPLTKGVICGKVSRYAEIQHGPRIMQPMLRQGPKGLGDFRPVSWDCALDHIAEQLQAIMGQFGPEAVLPFHYGGTMGVIQRRAYQRLVTRAGFSVLDGNICYSIGWAGWRAGVGLALGPDPIEIAASDLPILWGINAVSTHITLMSHVKQARRQGARLVVVDPYRNPTARLADWHLPVRPGTDGALAVAMMHVLLDEGLAQRSYLQRLTDFDAEVEAHLACRPPEWAAPITGLDASTIREFARLYGQARAPFIRIGLGMSRQYNGAVNLHAVSCLPAMTGAWEKVGGGALFATGGAFNLTGEPMPPPLNPRHTPRKLDMSRLGAILTDPGLNPPVKALLVSHANPAASCPDLQRVWSGLARDDLFTVVHEQVMSDTARFADVLLPATTFLEHEDLYKAYGQYTLQHARALMPPTGEALCNHDFVNALARRLGYDDLPFQMGVTETIAAILEHSGLPPVARWERPWIDCAPEWRAGHFLDGFPQPDGRFHFRPGWSQARMPEFPDHWPVNRRDNPVEAAVYPLDFMTPPAMDVLNSTFSDTPKARQQPPRLWIHPADAAQRQIQEGDRVVVFNGQGQLTMQARVTTDVRPGLTLCESNQTARAFPQGIGLNTLTHADVVAPDGGPALHDNRVEVYRLP
ncbi:MAG: molybdopterin-dependent oxidoreductase [Magnetococcales bacterium]|nr:molybdopterin-dependent oxidoreductase [Magnetococcales bacterium]NGZ06753.1 molybdopterin-dependent oxidoreductase [Magnetococcales bacterium]